MAVIESVEQLLIGRVTFPFTSYLLNRRGILARYDELRRSEHFSPEQMRELQLKRLQQLIAYAYERVPFYRSLFKDLGLKPGDITSLEDLRKVPPLGRQDVIDRHHAMVDHTLSESRDLADRSVRAPGEPILFAPFRRHRLVRNTSSGSTGAPTVFYEDGSRTALNWAHEHRLKSWFGNMPGAREARMVRLSTEYLPKSRVLRLRNRLWNQLILPGVNLTDREYAVCIEKLALFRPKTLWGYTSALAGFADYLKRSSINPAPWGIRLVVSWAAPIYDHERRILEEVFACPVSNLYGAREVGQVAGQCPAGSYHINQEHLLVERDDDAADHADREEGEILVTTLDISPMPFIRYRMGDIGRIAPSTCSCGRTLPVLQEFVGRTGEIFHTRDGRMISPNFWCRTFMNGRLSGAIRRFQVVYLNDHAMRIRIVKNGNYTEATEQVLADYLKKNFPNDMEFSFAYVPDIAPQVSGKYQMVVNAMSGRQTGKEVSPEPEYAADADRRV
jgi:phenylacetate-CoA ligase